MEREQIKQWITIRIPQQGHIMSHYVREKLQKSEHFLRRMLSSEPEGPTRN